MTLRQVAAVVGGEVAPAGGDDVVVSGPATLDSREVEPGGLFVAIAGERVDGHAFAEAAAAAGAAAAIGSRPTALPTVVVPDATVALGRLARHVRDELARRGALTVLAMTGSQGKTGTKDHLAHVLASVGETVATRGNLNNELGVPLTVLRADERTRWLVVEMGARGVGHVAELCAVARPDAAAVLNVGSAHLGEFGSREAIAQAKGEIVETLGADGTAVLNAADPLVAPMAARTAARVLTFGPASSGAAVTYDDVVLDDLARAAFTLGAAGESHRVALRQVGPHQVPNAAAAAALAVAGGVPLAAVATALATSEAASRRRMEVTERADGTVVLDDCYNANPESMAAALDTLRLVGERRGARRVAVLGDMLELGSGEVEEHRALGRAAAAAGVDLLVTVGPLAAHAAAAYTESRGHRGETVLTAGRDEAAARVGENVAAGDVVLVKASRGVALEHVVAALAHDRPGEQQEETVR
ncbi:UDP-N-acetylmuramoyl-tripeptide--D-alanyl-D-alanine ligase [Nocardioides perillae]|uniref:UDP-N-acetylmuramoyl-tripeptide--D-alanyl-D-alanine ligase n=1 Tax=Nocardioides perillae TaxID=1119534 RepID=A0A7Y9USQ7_9ACTN|nr:UDP-N-acetylmuramoyl-tripeptide--D-alanyl-D-alanine ligase [Nocardioides perillae]NYG56234.1 UDP-N-acetylmuramoyl-tripeptide--D-alanyl-D-alanine ligase [Nocardioides perillae]